MENFFTPTRRFQDRHDYILAGYTEVQLAVSIEAFMNHPWDWSAFYAFATEGELWKLLWITDDTFICIEDKYTSLDLILEMVDSAIQRATFTQQSAKYRNSFWRWIRSHRLYQLEHPAFSSMQ
jgi:hypothetical protein